MNHSKGASASYSKGSRFVVTLILLSMISCSKPVLILPPEEAQLVICKDGNEEQKASWNRVVKLAKMRGDPAGLAPGVLWAGGHLWRCRR